MRRCSNISKLIAYRIYNHGGKEGVIKVQHGKEAAFIIFQIKRVDNGRFEVSMVKQKNREWVNLNEITEYFNFLVNGDK